MNLGERVYLPITVKELPSNKEEGHFNPEEVNFVRSLELYKVLKLLSLLWSKHLLVTLTGDIHFQTVI